MNTSTQNRRSSAGSHVGFFVAMFVVVVCAGAAYYALDKFLISPTESKMRTEEKNPPLPRPADHRAHEVP